MNSKTISFLSPSLVALCLLAGGCFDSSGDPMGSDETGDAGDESGDTGGDDDLPTPGDDDSSGGDPDPDPDPDDTGSTGDEGDSTPPTIVSVAPADMSMGVDATTDIVITFSEPMDQSSAQAAYQSADIPAGDVTFSWNAAGDELTIDPNDDLEYAAGTDLETVVANVYAYSLTTTASDLAGNNLEATTEVEFSTAREISMTLALDPALTGDIDGGGGINMGNSRAGDFHTNLQVRALMSFDVGQLPADSLGVVRATLRGFQFVLGGQNPYGLGELQLGQVTYTELEAGTFNIAADADLGVIATASGDEIAVDVADAVRSAIEGGGHAQFRMSFPLATDGDNSPDVLSLLSPGLDVSVLVE
jgi:hypothetical protein